jgi:hypothetical protein
LRRNRSSLDVRAQPIEYFWHRLKRKHPRRRAAGGDEHSEHTYVRANIEHNGVLAQDDAALQVRFGDKYLVMQECGFTHVQRGEFGHRTGARPTARTVPRQHLRNHTTIGVHNACTGNTWIAQQGGHSVTHLGHHASSWGLTRRGQDSNLRGPKPAKPLGRLR